MSDTTDALEQATPPSDESEFDEPSRDGVCIWPSWIAPLIAGDRHCWWSAWYRAHYLYTKREEDETAQERLAQWKADHAAMLADRVRVLREQHRRRDVTIERQNKLTVRGRTATISAQPDIVYSGDYDAVIEDMKTGQARDGDWWQVFIYCWLYMIVHGVEASGRVLYRDRTSREVRAEDVGAQSHRVLDAIATVSGETPPERVPSASECTRCPIAYCPDRVESAEVEATTEAF